MDKEEEIVVVTESASSEDVTITPAERLAAFEKEKMSRRAVLGRFGLLAGAAAVAALTADELTRMVGSELERRSAGNKATEQVAKELKNAGVALADPPAPYIDCTPSPLGENRTHCCRLNYNVCIIECEGNPYCEAQCLAREESCRITGVF